MYNIFHHYNILDMHGFTSKYISTCVPPMSKQIFTIISSWNKLPFYLDGPRLEHNKMNKIGTQKIIIVNFPI